MCWITELNTLERSSSPHLERSSSPHLAEISHIGDFFLSSIRPFFSHDFRFFGTHDKRSTTWYQRFEPTNLFFLWVPNVLIPEYRAFRVHPRDRARGFGKKIFDHFSNLSIIVIFDYFPKNHMMKKKNDHPQGARELPWALGPQRKVVWDHDFSNLGFLDFCKPAVWFSKKYQLFAKSITTFALWPLFTNAKMGCFLPRPPLPRNGRGIIGRKFWGEYSRCLRIFAQELKIWVHHRARIPFRKCR